MLSKLSVIMSNALFKVWDHIRTTKKIVIAKTLEGLLSKCKYSYNFHDLIKALFFLIADPTNTENDKSVFTLLWKFEHLGIGWSKTVVEEVVETYCALVTEVDPHQPAHIGQGLHSSQYSAN